MRSRIGICSDCGSWVSRNGSLKAECDGCGRKADVPVISLQKPRLNIEPSSFEFEATEILEYPESPPFLTVSQHDSE